MATEKNIDAKKTTKKTTAKKTGTKVSTTKKVTEAPKEAPKKAVEKKVFTASDLIRVSNVFPGTVAFVGKKTNAVYVLEGIDDEAYIEYQDLRPMCLSRRNRFIWDPQIVICDADFLKEFPALNDVYEKMMTPEDIKETLLSMNERRIKNMINKATENIKENIKTITASMINDGELDSVRIVNIVDERLETELYKQLINK